jgi:hypothetical protein
MQQRKLPVIIPVAGMLVLTKLIPFRLCCATSTFRCRWPAQSPSAARPSFLRLTAILSPMKTTGLQLGD